MAVERFIVGQKYVLPDELVAKFDDLVELMMSTDDQAFYDLAIEFGNEFGEYAYVKSD